MEILQYLYIVMQLLMLSILFISITTMTTECGPKKRRLWTDLSMTEAYNAVIEAKVSISAAAQRFGVPRMALSDRPSGRIQCGAKLGNQTALLPGEEDALVRYIKVMQTQRFLGTQKVIFLRNSKHAQTRAIGTSEHICVMYYARCWSLCSTTYHLQQRTTNTAWVPEERSRKCVRQQIVDL